LEKIVRKPQGVLTHTVASIRGENGSSLAGSLM